MLLRRAIARLGGVVAGAGGAAAPAARGVQAMHSGSGVCSGRGATDRLMGWGGTAGGGGGAAAREWGVRSGGGGREFAARGYAAAAVGSSAAGVSRGGAVAFIASSQRAGGCLEGLGAMAGVRSAEGATAWGLTFARSYAKAGSAKEAIKTMKVRTSRHVQPSPRQRYTTREGAGGGTLVF
jgi:hypothetical protein